MSWQSLVEEDKVELGERPSAAGESPQSQVAVAGLIMS